MNTKWSKKRLQVPAEGAEPKWGGEGRIQHYHFPSLSNGTKEHHYLLYCSWEYNDACIKLTSLCCNSVQIKLDYTQVKHQLWFYEPSEYSDQQDFRAHLQKVYSKKLQTFEPVSGLLVLRAVHQYFVSGNRLQLCSLGHVNRKDPLNRCCVEQKHLNHEETSVSVIRSTQAEY